MNYKHLLLAMLPGVACNAVAAEAAADSLSVLNLDEVVVVATRATDKTPVAFTNVTARELERVNTGIDLPYLLQATPSVITTSDAGTGIGYSSIRVRGTDGSRINVTANGIPVNDAESHNVYWVNMPDFTSSLRDIQIQRGAGTSTNGAGAFGASINMQTTNPAFKPYAQIDATYGMYNTNKETLRVGSGLLGGHWTVDARLSHIGTDGYIARASSELWSYFGQLGYYNGATSVKLVAFGGKERTYQAWDYASKEDMEEYGRRYNPCGEYTDSEGNTAYYPNQYDNYTQHHFQLLFNHRFNSQWALDLALHYTKGDGYYDQYKEGRSFIEYGLDDYVDASGETISESDLVRYKKMDNGFGGGVFSVRYVNGRVSAVVGGGANNYRGHHFGQVAWVRNYIGTIDPLQEYYRNVGEKLDANVYARANVDIVGGLSAYADLQYRHISYSITGVSDTYDWNIMAMQQLDIHRHFNFFNPKAGLDYRINNNMRAYASFAVAHREPTRDNFIDCSPDRLPKAERLNDYELGYQYASGIFNAGINLYYMDYKDQLVPTGQLSDTGNAVSENVDRSYRMGAELTLMVKPIKWFDWQFTATLSRNRVKDFVEYIYEDEWTNPITFERGDTPLAFSPDFTFHNSFNFNVSGFDASLLSRYVSKQYMTNTGNEEAVLDPYFVTDLHLGYTFQRLAGIKEMRIGAIVYNLFNEEYENNGYAGAGYYKGDDGEPIIYRYAGYAAQAPIHFAATLSLKF
ncbi:MAG: TonB-dependent receptor [Muribaculaceae bacterium]|nr:TonB-dependent receptor [Muribaculaceae bacterium]